MAERHLRSVPDRPDPDVYGYVDYFDGQQTHRLTIAVMDVSGDPAQIVRSASADIVLATNGFVLRHPYEAGHRMSTEEERAAVGWTW
jgi:hypothetical protein